MCIISSYYVFMEDYYIHICNIKTLIVSESLYLFSIINFL